MEINPILAKKFFTDPDWPEVESILMSYVEGINNIKEIDVDQHPDTVKAELIGRKIAYEKITEFLREVKMVNTPRTVKQATFK